MDRSVGSPWNWSIVGVCGPGVSVFRLRGKIIFHKFMLCYKLVHSIFIPPSPQQPTSFCCPHPFSLHLRRSKFYCWSCARGYPHEGIGGGGWTRSTLGVRG